MSGGGYGRRLERKARKKNIKNIFKKFDIRIHQRWRMVTHATAYTHTLGTKSRRFHAGYPFFRTMFRRAVNIVTRVSFPPPRARRARKQLSRDGCACAPLGLSERSRALSPCSLPSLHRNRRKARVAGSIVRRDRQYVYVYHHQNGNDGLPASTTARKRRRARIMYIYIYI